MKYSIDEIDRMRIAVKQLTWYDLGSKSDDKSIIEDRLRTHMINGTSCEELENAAQKANEDCERRIRERKVSK